MEIELDKTFDFGRLDHWKKWKDITTVSTGVIMEEKCFTWKIENFDVVRKSKEMIHKQRFDFHAGDTLGLPSDWSCRLWYSVKPNPPILGNDLISVNNDSLASAEWIGVFFHLEKIPEGVEELTFVFNYMIYKQNGDVYYNLEVPVKCLSEVGDTAGWGKKCVILKRAPVEHLPLIDGALVIHSKFRLYAHKPADTDILAKTSRFQTLSIQKLGVDLAASVQQSTNFSCGPASGTRDSTVKIISKDGQEFLVDRGFLSARSKVFQVMFQSQMQETQTGVIHLKDLSSQTVSVLLHFIYTGILQDKWRHPEVIVEFTYAAEKYELIELLQFLDEVLGTICTKETAGKLLVLVSRISLKKAEREILSFIQRNATNTQQLIAFAKDIAGADVNIMNDPNIKSENLIELSRDTV